jgi:WD40 repeat protein
MRLKVLKVSELQGHNGAIFSVFSDQEEKHLYTTGGDGWLVRWNLNDPETGKLIAKTDIQNFSAIQTSKDNFVCGNMHGGIHFIDLQEPESQGNILHHKKGTFAFVTVEDQLISAGGDGKITKWNLARKLPEASLQISHTSIRTLLYISELDLLIAGASDNNIYALRPDDFSQVWMIENAHENSVFSLAYIPENTTLVSGGRDAMIKFWNLCGGQPEPLHAVPAHLFTVNDIVYCKNTGLIASASRDKTIKLWDAKTFKLVKVLEGLRDGGHYNSVNKLCWLEKRNCLVSVGDDRMGHIWHFQPD